MPKTYRTYDSFHWIALLLRLLLHVLLLVLVLCDRCVAPCRPDVRHHCLFDFFRLTLLFCLFIFGVHRSRMPRSETQAGLYAIKLDYDEANRASCYLHENAAVTTINNSKWVFALIYPYRSLLFSFSPFFGALCRHHLAQFHFGALILWIKNRLKINRHTEK